MGEIAIKKQTAFRLDSKLLDMLKSAAKLAQTLSGKRSETNTRAGGTGFAQRSGFRMGHTSRKRHKME